MPYEQSSFDAVIHIDGASRGNPGPAAYAVVVESGAGAGLGAVSKYIGHTTNNVAEYQALLAALDYARQRRFRRIRIHTDSELMKRQIDGDYQVKSPDLLPLHRRALQSIAGFETFSIVHIPRERNAEADRLANEALDIALNLRGPSMPSDYARPQTIKVPATYRNGILELKRAVPLEEGEEVEIEIRRKPQV